MPLLIETLAEDVLEELYRVFNQNMVVGETRPTFYSSATYQDFNDIRSRCLDEGRLFEDPEFELSGSWRRPHEMVRNPKFFVDGQSRFDVNQGNIGDCWLLSVVANLTQHKQLFSRVVPDDQGFGEDYAGVFHFRFWWSGRWMEVVIDDRLPTNHQGELIFVQSSETNEFWSALLEKAFAKLLGSYRAIHMGKPKTAMVALTGGVSEWYGQEQFTSNFYTILLKAYERNSLIVAVTPHYDQYYRHDSNGLPRGHAYSITRVKLVAYKTPGGAGKIPLLRIRNPWGNMVEWNGPWSDGSQQWRYIPQSEREELGLTVNDDGEFWMSYEDFVKFFIGVEICNLESNFLDPEEYPEERNKKWETSIFDGEWFRGFTGSGCRKNLDSSSRNPQYTVTLTDPDEGDDQNKCTMIVALTQKNILHAGLTTPAVGFAVYKMPVNKQESMPLDVNSLNDNECVGRCQDLTKLREATARFKLDPGTYVIVPSTFGPDQEGEFLLRVFSEKAINMAEHVVRDVHSTDDRVKEVPTDIVPASANIGVVIEDLI